MPITAPLLVLSIIRLPGNGLLPVSLQVFARQLSQTLIVFHDKNLPALLLHHTHSCDRRAPIETRGIVTTPGVLHSACQRLSKTQHIVLSCDACSILNDHCQRHLNGDEWSHTGKPKAHAGWPKLPKVNPQGYPQAGANCHLAMICLALYLVSPSRQTPICRVLVTYRPQIECPTLAPSQATPGNSNRSLQHSSSAHARDAKSSPKKCVTVALIRCSAPRTHH